MAGDSIRQWAHTHRLAVRIVPVCAAVIAACGCASPPDRQVCRDLLPHTATDVQVQQVGEKAYQCTAHIDIIPISAIITREDGGWTLRAATVDGKTVPPDRIHFHAAAAMEVDPERCTALIGPSAAGVRTAQTPSGTPGCFGWIDNIPVVIEAQRTRSGWTTTRAWVDGDEVAPDAIRAEAQQRRSAADQQRTRNDQQIARAEERLIEEMRDRAIERSSLLHPMSELVSVTLDHSSRTAAGDDEFRVDCTFTIKFRSRIVNIFSGTYKKSTVRINAVGSLYSRNGLPWDGHTVAVEVVENH